MKKAAMIFSLAIGLMGCAAISTGVQVSDSQVSQFKKGETTKAQVLAALGPPTQQTKQSDGTSSLIYSYGESKARPESYIPIVGLFAGVVDTRANTVLLQFDASDKLLSSGTTTSEKATTLWGTPTTTPVAPQQK